MARHQPTLTHSLAPTLAPGDTAQLSYYTATTAPATADDPNLPSSRPCQHLLVLHGAMTMALTHRDLALLLAGEGSENSHGRTTMVVHTASRRGRGRSGPYPDSLFDGLEVREASSSGGNDDGGHGGGRPRTYSPRFASAVLATDIADLEALLRATGARSVIGVSSGALVVLGVLLALRGALAIEGLALEDLTAIRELEKVVIFEPPLLFAADEDDNNAHQPDPHLMRRYEDERDAGDDAAALVTAMRLVQLGPAWIPRWAMERLTGWMLAAEEGRATKRKSALAKRGAEKETAAAADSDGSGRKKEGVDDGDDDGVVGMRALGRMLRFDFALVEAMVGPAARFAALRPTRPPGSGPTAAAEQTSVGVSSQEPATVDTAAARTTAPSPDILLLSGAKTPAYLAHAMRVLGRQIHGSESSVVVLPGVGHEVLCGPEMRGRPAKAVTAIREFLS